MIQTATILPILTYIQTHLDEDLSLATLAGRVNLSPFHFHRVFQDVVGETLKKYTQRLRLERAAFELKIRDDSVLQIALSNGFQTHETFSRAFKRQFGISPLKFRRQHGVLPADRIDQNLNTERPQILNRYADKVELSAVRIQHLGALPLAFIRHLGHYETVDPSLFDQLTEWAQQRRGWSTGSILVGIGHDDPAVTPPNKLRFDACLVVPERFKPEERIGCQDLPAGNYATITYVGPYGSSMGAGYEAIFNRVMQSSRYRLVGLPAIEIYRTTHINPDYDLNETDIYLPVEAVA